MSSIFDYKTIDLSNIFFDDPKKIRGGSYMSLGYYNTGNTNDKKLDELIIQTPRLNICNSGENKMFIDLEFDKNHWPFYEFMSGVDEHSIVYIQKNSNRWFSKSFPLDIVDDFYKTPIKSQRNKTPPRLRLKFPLVKGEIESKVFNNHNEVIPPEQIFNYDKVVCVMKLVGLKFLKQQVSCEWLPLQFKVSLKEKPIETKYLIDDTLLSEDECDNNSNNLAQFIENSEISKITESDFTDENIDENSDDDIDQNIDDDIDQNIDDDIHENIDQNIDENECSETQILSVNLKNDNEEIQDNDENIELELDLDELNFDENIDEINNLDINEKNTNDIESIKDNDTNEEIDYKILLEETKKELEKYKSSFAEKDEKINSMKEKISDFYKFLN